ncbi:MAG: hypothetical protein ACK5O2_08655 [Microthrixaceae bacterium]
MDIDHPADPATDTHRSTDLPRSAGAQVSADVPVMRFAPWWEPDLALCGHDPTGGYVETYWTPVLGPASTMTLRWVTHMFELHGGGFEIPFGEFAARIGLGARKGRHSPAARCVDRLRYFNLASIRGEVLIRTHVPSLPAHLRRRLPSELRRSLPRS